MKRYLLMILSAMAITLSAEAQSENNLLQNLDLEEDTTHVTSMNDIIAMHQIVVANKDNERHFTDVWRRNAVFNISKNNAVLSASSPAHIQSHSSNPSYSNEWGYGIQAGVSYKLHKPIMNAISFGLDLSWVDLNVNHYKAEENASYDSMDKFTEEGEEKYCMPWDLEKYEADYGMSVGPSVTVAPFVPLGVKPLDYIRVQCYFHIGYSASLTYSPNDEKLDVNPNHMTVEYETMANNPKINWGMGVYNSIGFNITWKEIGVGYEHRKSSYGYKALVDKNFGNVKNTFDTAYNRIYLQFRM